MHAEVNLHFAFRLIRENKNFSLDVSIIYPLQLAGEGLVYCIRFFSLIELCGCGSTTTIDYREYLATGTVSNNTPFFFN